MLTRIRGPLPVGVTQLFMRELHTQLTGSTSSSIIKVLRAIQLAICYSYLQTMAVSGIFGGYIIFLKSNLFADSCRFLRNVFLKTMPLSFYRRYCVF